VFQVDFSFSSGVVVQLELMRMMVLLLRNAAASSDSDPLLWFQRGMLQKKVLPCLIAQALYVINLFLKVYVSVAEMGVSVSLTQNSGKPTCNLSPWILVPNLKTQRQGNLNSLERNREERLKGKKVPWKRKFWSRERKEQEKKKKGNSIHPHGHLIWIFSPNLALF